ncbi:MAG: CDGSH iron-sulfur domain-containing protein [Hyphomicrobiaceae bacterium]
MSDDPVIEERENGPLVAKNVSRLVGAEGQDIETKPVMALCRCGESQKKPFCDGTHNQIGFKSDAEDTTSRDKVFTYSGKEVTVHYNRLLCSHAAVCGEKLKAVFDSSRRPWIVPDNGSAEAIKDVVAACPSGALRYSDSAHPPEHISGSDVCITIQKDGPYQVTNVAIDGVRRADGACVDKFVLCRCGKSGNKPFCDGAHHDAQWRDEGSAE